MTKKPKKIRLDELLVEQGVFPDAGTVLRAVLAHEVKVDDVYVTSAAVKVERRRVGERVLRAGQAPV